MNLNTLETTELITTRTDMKCAVCDKHKATLKPRKSKLTGANLLLCVSCFDNKYEPRWAIIVVARSPKMGGLVAVRDYIRNHKYVGEKIRADEILPLS